MPKTSHTLYLKWLGINTYREAVVYMHKNCHICRSEGFEAQTRIEITLDQRSIIATLNIIDSELLGLEEASLSNYAWELLGAKEHAKIYISHPKPLRSLKHIRAKIYGHELNSAAIYSVIKDVVAGRLSDIHIASFLAASAGNRLNQNEILEMTKAMVEVGQKLTWPANFIVDKHCIGGIPGNRTSMIIVPIVAAFGLTIPKTSSRAITSPAGTADTMEVFCPVNLDIASMRRVVEQENGCLVWGGSVSLSPADDILIRIESALDLDIEGQLVASVLSKKIAAGSTHVLIDIPIGDTAKVRSFQTANLLKNYLEFIGAKSGIKIIVIFTDGSQPIGQGIGPALEANDVMKVLQNEKDAPNLLREHALMLAGQILEMSHNVLPGTGKKIAQDILENGQAWQKFQNICHAQGGMIDTLPIAKYKQEVVAKNAGKVIRIDNRRLAYIAKLAGAPKSKVAGIELLVSINTKIEKGEPLYIVHAATPGELDYAVTFLKQEPDVIKIEQDI